MSRRTKTKIGKDAPRCGHVWILCKPRACSIGCSCRQSVRSTHLKCWSHRHNIQAWNFFACKNGISAASQKNICLTFIQEPGVSGFDLAAGRRLWRGGRACQLECFGIQRCISSRADAVGTAEQVPSLVA